MTRDRDTLSDVTVRRRQCNDPPDIPWGTVEDTCDTLLRPSSEVTILPSTDYKSSLLLIRIKGFEIYV